MAAGEKTTCSEATFQDTSLLLEEQAPVLATYQRTWQRRILAASLVIGALVCCTVGSKKLLSDSQQGQQTSSAVTKEGVMRSWVLPQPGQEQWTPATDKIAWIGICSAPYHFSRRAALRSAWVTMTRQNYAARIDVQYVIGQVPIQNNELHQLPMPVASPKEIEMEQKIQAEMKQHGDILRIPTVEGYQFLPIKALQLFALGARSGAKYVLKIDDDQTFYPQNFITWADQRAASGKTGPVYVGPFLIQGAIRQADGNYDKFIYGPCYGLSGDLAWQIAIADFDHSIAFPTYGLPNDDADMGIWTKYENQLRLAQGLPAIDVEIIQTYCGAGPQGLDPGGTSASWKAR